MSEALPEVIDWDAGPGEIVEPDPKAPPVAPLGSINWDTGEVTPAGPSLLELGDEVMAPAPEIPPVAPHMDPGFQSLPWAQRALTSPEHIQNPDGTQSSVRTAFKTEIVGKNPDGSDQWEVHVYPTIRMVEGQLRQMGDDEAYQYALQAGDVHRIPAGVGGPDEIRAAEEQAQALTSGFSDYLGSRGPQEPEPAPQAPLMARMMAGLAGQTAETFEQAAPQIETALLDPGPTRETIDAIAERSREPVVDPIAPGNMGPFATAAGNVPRDIANIGGMIAGQGIRAGKAGIDFSQSVAAGMVGDRAASREHYQAAIEEIQPLAEEIGTILKDVVRIPASIAEPVIRSIAPALAYQMRENGWTYGQVVSELETNPVGTSLFILDLLPLGRYTGAGKGGPPGGGGTLDPRKAAPPDPRFQTREPVAPSDTTMVLPDLRLAEENVALPKTLEGPDGPQTGAGAPSPEARPDTVPPQEPPAAAASEPITRLEQPPEVEQGMAPPPAKPEGAASAPPDAEPAAPRAPIDHQDIGRTNAEMGLDHDAREYKTLQDQIDSYRENVNDSVLEQGGTYDDVLRAHEHFDEVVRKATGNTEGRTYMAGERVKIGRGKWWVLESKMRKGKMTYLVSKTKTGRGNAQKHVVKEDAIKGPAETVVKQKGPWKPKSDLPDHWAEDPQAVVDHIRSVGVWEDKLDATTMNENYPRKPGEPNMARRGGLSLDGWADQLGQESGPFRDVESARQWLDAKFEMGDGAKARDIGKDPMLSGEAEAVKALENKAERWGIRKGADLDKIGEAWKGDRKSEPIDPDTLKPGDVVYIEDKGDVYRVEPDGKGGVILKDGEVLPLNDMTIYRGIEVGKGTEGLKAERPTMEDAAKSIEDAKVEREAREATEATVEGKRAEAEKTGQGDMFDPEANKRISDKATEDAKAAAEAKKQTSLDDFYKKKGAVSDADIAGANKARKDLNGKLYSAVGPDPKMVKAVVRLGVYHAKALARIAKDGIARFPEWNARVRAEWEGLFTDAKLITDKQMRRIWMKRPVRAAKRRRYDPPVTPKSHGKLAEFERSHRRGGEAYDAWRIADNRVKLGVRMLGERQRTLRKEIGKAGETQLYLTLRGIPRKVKGKYDYGSIVRAGTRDIPRRRGPEQAVLDPPGTMLDDGRVVGHKIEGTNKQQLYRVIWPEEAQALHENLKADHPKAAELMDRILEREEPAIETAYGDRLPTMSRRVLKRDYGIEGLTRREAKMASELVRQAYGPLAEGRRVPNQFSWVPEQMFESTSVIGRYRNSLRAITASNRRLKTGAAGEKITARITGGELPATGIVDGYTRAQAELFREIVHNDMSSQIISMVAEPIGKGETLKSMSENGYVPLSTTQLYGESIAFRQFAKRNAGRLEAAGISVPDVVSATYIAGGKAYKVNKALVEQLAPLFDESRYIDGNTKIAKRKKAVNDALDDFVSTVNVGRLWRVSTANRNLISNKIIFLIKTLRDLNEAAIGAMLRTKTDRPFQDAVSNLRGLGLALGKKSRKRIPPEMLGQTFGTFHQSGRVSQAAGKVLQYTGFQHWDVYTKRVIYEGVYDAWAHRVYYAAKEAGEIPRGMTRKKYVENLKKDIPPEIESLAYREMDTWGGYDYANIPRWLEKWKRLPAGVGRFTVPYPTYLYKLSKTYGELYGPNNVKVLLGRHSSRKARARAAANMATGVQMAAISYLLTPDMDNLPDGMKATDLPYDVQTRGRVKVPFYRSKEGNEAWVRLYDIPFIGEAMAAKAMWHGEMTLADYVNDRLSLGPLFNSVAVLTGMFNDYNKHITRASRLGREMASWVPGSAQVQTIRRLVDPKKREISKKRDLALKNYGRAFINNLPWASALLDEKVDEYRKALPEWSGTEQLYSQFVLNVKFIDPDKRDFSIKMAELGLTRDHIDELSRDRLREQMLWIDKNIGENKLAEISQRKKEAEINAGLAGIKAEHAVMVAWREGGEGAALKKLRELQREQTIPYNRKKVTQGGMKVIRRFRREDRLGLIESEIRRAPPHLRRELREAN